MRPNIFSFIPFSLSVLAFEQSYICFLISLTFGAIVFFFLLFFFCFQLCFLRCAAPYLFIRPNVAFRFGSACFAASPCPVQLHLGLLKINCIVWLRSKRPMGVAKRERVRERRRERLAIAQTPKYEAKAQLQKDIARLMVFCRGSAWVGVGTGGCAIYQMRCPLKYLIDLPIQLSSLPSPTLSPFLSLSRSVSLSVRN